MYQVPKSRFRENIPLHMYQNTLLYILLSFQTSTTEHTESCQISIMTRVGSALTCARCGEKALCRVFRPHLPPLGLSKHAKSFTCRAQNKEGGPSVYKQTRALRRYIAPAALVRFSRHQQTSLPHFHALALCYSETPRTIYNSRSSTS